MLKVYMKGFDRPYAVFGDYVFEDERFLVIENQGMQSRIPHSNIFYIEALTQTVAAAAPTAPTAEPRAATEPAVSMTLKNALDRAMSHSAGALDEQEAPVSWKGETKQTNVIFAGFKQQTFSIPIPVELLNGEFAPKLSQVIFTNPQIKAFMGDFIMSGTPTVDGETITINTAPLKPKTDMLKAKLDTTTQFLNKMMSATKPSATMSPDDDFSMPASPFSTTISLQDFDE